MAASRKDLQNLLDRTPFLRGYGFRVHSLRPGWCTIRVPRRPGFERPDGIVGGPILITAADVAMWLAIYTRIELKETAVTVEMKTNFLRSLRKAPFYCRARVIKLGRRLVYGTAECYAVGHGLLAHHTLTYIRLP